MKWSNLIILLLALCAPLTADAQSTRSASSTQTAADATPTLPTSSDAAISSTTSLNLWNVMGYRVVVCAESGQTLSGSGTLDAYVWDHSLGLWIPNNDLNLTVDEAVARCQAFPDGETRARVGRVMYIANNVTVSGGTNVVVSIIGYVNPN